MRDFYAIDENRGGLADAIHEMHACAHRHLSNHSCETIEAIFYGVFPSTVINNALDDIAMAHDTAAEIQRLAKLPLLKYERERKAAAAQLNIRPSALDSLVKSARPQYTKGQGRTFEFPPIEPWPEPVDGAELLDEICTAIGRHVVLPRNSVITLALWALHTHCFDCFGISPRAAIISPEKGCGKTTTLDVLSCLVARPLPTSNTSVSPIFRIVELHAPTLLMDEADTFLKENDELRGILNSGHRRGAGVLRSVGDDHEPRRFSTWAPVAIAMIGRLPDTLNDRSLVIDLRRRKPSEKVDSFRLDRAEHLKVLQRKMASWADDHQKWLAASDPDMGELVNRVADNWRPLFAIAGEAGGAWPERVREAAGAAVAAMVEESANIKLFEHVKSIFDGSESAAPIDRITSADLVDRLIKIEGAPWPEWKGGKPITQNGLARLLSKFEILPGTIRIGNDTAKGYYRTAFDDVFGRYLPPQTVTPSQRNSHGHCDGLQSVTTKNRVTVSQASQRNNHARCDGVTVAKEGIGKIDAVNYRRCDHCRQFGDLMQCAYGTVEVWLHRKCRDPWQAEYDALSIPSFLDRRHQQPH